MRSLAHRPLVRPAALVVAAAVALITLFVSPSTAQAASTVGARTVVTKSGLSLTVAPARQLNPAGATVRVVGKGFNPTVGIYVALCVTPAKGQTPSPCGGGVNTSGTSAASFWISSNPPPYGSTLAIPYRKGGRFAVTLQVSSMIGDVDCRTVSCSIVTRADHTRPGERAYDVIVPVTFRP